MPPSTFVGLLLFLWLVTPGFIFSWAANRRRALHTETAFQEVSRVVLASVGFSTAAGLIVVGLDALLGLTGRGVDLRRVLTADYLRAEVGGVVGYLLLQVAIACGLALAVDRQIRRRITQKKGKPPPQLRAESAWTEPFGLRPEGASPHAWVRLKSGLELRGKVAAVGHDIPIADRELVLTRPLRIRPPGGSLQELRWQLVIVQGADIDALAVRYERDAPDQPTPTARS